MGRILYVTDLDGTLLGKDQRISIRSADVINRLRERGMLFSYATARSTITASKIAQDIRSDIPIIVYNGAFIMESHTRRVLMENYFERCDSEEILAALWESGVDPITYAVINGAEKFSYVRSRVTPGAEEFILSRAGDVRDNPVDHRESLKNGRSFYFACIDAPEKLAPLYERFRNRFSCVYHKDIYTGYQWLELMPGTASKARAVLRLKSLMGADKVIAFGDGKNDIPMFQIADECYAVANAVDALKAIATGVIGANYEDGVAKWLEENFAG